MQTFVARRNVEHFRHLIDQETDPAERRRLQQMLAEEEAKLRDAQADPPRSGP